MTRFFYSCAHEQFHPSDLLRQAVAAEQAGFDGIGCSDHFQPWWDGGESAQAWVWLGALGQVTERIPIGSAVTAPVYRYHPALVAQAFATLEAMYPGRAYLGIGSGESLNESPLGMDWPSPAEQLGRMEEALEIIGRLFDGEKLDYRGRYFTTDGAYLHTRPKRRPPIYVSAFAPQAARAAGRLGDGLWSLANPDAVPDLIDAYRAGAEEAQREPGEILLQTGFSWAASDEQALEAARPWKGAGPPEYYVDDWHVPGEMYRHAEATIDDDAFRELQIISSDPAEHAERIRAVEQLGATTVVLMNISGADPMGAIDTYREHVLPALRGAGERAGAAGRVDER
jgi:coenzyme F420-dependent glucose-6-phosphate dehydrogenase